MLKLTLLFSLFVFLAVLLFLQVAYCGWRTAAETDPAQLHNAQVRFYIWFSLFAATIICAIGMIVRMFFVYRAIKRGARTDH
jgi:heme/copper-type cytochrome/quinol oxidase subunit 2